MNIDYGCVHNGLYVWITEKGKVVYDFFMKRGVGERFEDMENISRVIGELRKIGGKKELEISSKLEGYKSNDLRIKI